MIKDKFIFFVTLLAPILLAINLVRILGDSNALNTKVIMDIAQNSFLATRSIFEDFLMLIQDLADTLSRFNVFGDGFAWYDLIALVEAIFDLLIGICELIFSACTLLVFFLKDFIVLLSYIITVLAAPSSYWPEPYF